MNWFGQLITAVVLSSVVLAGEQERWFEPAVAGRWRSSEREYVGRNHLWRLTFKTLQSFVQIDRGGLNLAHNMAYERMPKLRDRNSARILTAASLRNR